MTSILYLEPSLIANTSIRGGRYFLHTERRDRLFNFVGVQEGPRMAHEGDLDGPNLADESRD